MLLYPISKGRQMPRQIHASKARKETFPERTSPALPSLLSVALLRGGLNHPTQIGALADEKKEESAQAEHERDYCRGEEEWWSMALSALHPGTRRRYCSQACRRRARASNSLSRTGRG